MRLILFQLTSTVAAVVVSGFDVAKNNDSRNDRVRADRRGVEDLIGSIVVAPFLDSRRLESLSPSASKQPSSAPSGVPSLSDIPSVSPSQALPITPEPSMLPSQAASASPTDDAASVAESQIEALQLFAASVGADASRALDDWFAEGISYCDYTGVGCDADQYIITLDLDEKALSGTLPESMGQFPRLRRLKALKNDLTGTLPSSLLFLSDLRQLNLGRNRLTGPLPSVTGMFPKLKRLHLHSNDLNGTVPSFFCSLSDLDALDISDNVLITGEIPSCFGELEKLTTFRVRNLGLTGDVPPALCEERPVNGLSPNPFGCEAIACPAGFYEPKEGRRISIEAPCLPCNVTSNVIGSTICQELDGNEVVIREPTVSPVPSQSPSLQPTDAPSVTPGPTLSPSVSASPSVAVPSSEPSLTPTVSTEPSTSPTVSVQPSVSSAPTLSSSPTLTPSSIPSFIPSSQPSSTPSDIPSAAPSASPTSPPSDAPSLVPSLAPSSSPSNEPNVNGVEGGDHVDDSSNRRKRGLLIGSMVTLFVALCIVAIFVARRQRRRNHEEVEDEEFSQSAQGDADAPMSVVDSVYLTDVEDGNGTEAGSKLSDLLEEGHDDGSGAVDVDSIMGVGGLDGVTMVATSPTEQQPQEPDISHDMGTAGLLPPSQMKPRHQALKRMRSDSKLGRVYPVQASRSEGDNIPSNPWFAKDEKEVTDLKLGVYGVLSQANSCASDDASMKSFSSRASNAPMLGGPNKSSLGAFVKSDECSASDTDSMSPSLYGEDLLGPTCQGWTLGGIRDKLRLQRSESY